jgi:DNA-binding SARP family transcriptional activator
MEVKVLGPVALNNGAGQIDIGGPRQQRLLAALTVNANRVVSSETLIEIVFEETPPDGARTTLRSYIARLRKSLEGADSPEAIVTESPGYMLRLDSDQSDVSRFSAAIEVAREQMDDEDAVDAATTLHSALNMWRGPAYGVFGDEDWVRAEAVRLEELRTDAWERLVDAQLACGLAAEVIPELTRLVGEHPYRDRLRSQMMLALYRSGRQAEALRSIERYRDELIEVGLELGPELAALERSVTAHDPALQLDTLAGTALRGYRLGAAIGDGPHSTVYRAIQPGVGREVALKAISGPIIDAPDFIRNFDRQAQFVSQLEHPHVVPLYDFWREPSGAYLVMRLLPANLTSHLDSGPLSPLQVITLVEQLSSALTAAHRLGVIHGDIRPSNVLVDHQDNVYLSDVGMAMFVQLSKTELDSRSGYESPEQLAGEPTTPRSDQFSLAVLVAHSLTGLMPFGTRAISTPADQMPSLHAQRRAAPEALDPVLARATAWSAQDRFESINEFGEAVIAALGGDPTRVIPIERTNPYRGLDAFTESDTAHFFGREEIIDGLVARFSAAGSDRTFVTLVGASGSGKSSIVRAGLVPRLRAGAVSGSRDWFVATMVPGNNPLAELEVALRPIASTRPATTNGEADQQSNSAAQLIAEAIPRDQTLLLIIDQLEELFTLTPEAERDHFISNLTELLRFGPHDVRVVATLRADFYDRPLRYGDFGRLITDNAVTVVGMSASELDRAIRKPAEGIGVEIEPAAAAEIVAEVVDQPAALPLLQFTLTELFERLEDDVITFESYRAIGGVEAAVAQRADSLYGQLSKVDQDRVRRIFLRLVMVDENGTATRRRATRNELASLEREPSEMDRILDDFGAARLLGFDRDSTTREPTVEVAHEALTTHWPLLRQWVAEEGDGLRIRNQLTAAAEAWDRDRHDESSLYRGSRLEVAAACFENEDASLTPLERDFLHAGLELHTRQAAAEREQLEHERRANRRLRGLVMGVGAALVFALVAGFVALGQRNEARDEAARADAQTRRTAIGELTVASRETLAIDPELSLLLAVEAVRAGGDEVVPGAQETLHRALLSNRLAAGARSAPGDPPPSRLTASGSWPSLATRPEQTSGRAIRRSLSQR